MDGNKSRGGKRDGSGRPPTWWSGKCKAVKIPESIADQVLEVAREIDKRAFVEEYTEAKTPLEQIVEIRKIVDLSESGVTGYGSKKDLLKELKKILKYTSKFNVPL